MMLALEVWVLVELLMTSERLKKRKKLKLIFDVDQCGMEQKVTGQDST